MVMCPDHPGLTFNLSLVRTTPTYNQPIQQWTFVSDFAVRSLFSLIIFLLIHFLLTPFNAKSPISGAGLLGHIHGQTAPMYVPSWPGVHHPPRLQPQRASNLRHGHQISAGGLMTPTSGDSYWEHLLIHEGNWVLNKNISKYVYDDMHLTLKSYIFHTHLFVRPNTSKILR